MSETILIVLGAVALLAVGIGLGFGLAQWRMRGQGARAGEIQKELDDYRREVTEHFGQTAEHFKAIGREYRELYEHMASGAESLTDREALDAKLSFAPKAILESIADEQQTQAAVDFEQADQPADEVPESSEGRGEERITVEAEGESVEALTSEAEAETGEESPRTLH